MKDPLTMCYEALWEILEKWEGFASRVRIGNRFKYLTHGEPEKAEVGNTDFPEIRIVPDGMEPATQISSSSTRIVQRFTVQVSTGSKQLSGHFGKDATLFPMEFEIFRAMVGWQTVLSALVWNGTSFAKYLDLTNTQQGSAETDLRRGVDGWASVWTCQVVLVFPLADLMDADLC